MKYYSWTRVKCVFLALVTIVLSTIFALAGNIPGLFTTAFAAAVIAVYYGFSAYAAYRSIAKGEQEIIGLQQKFRRQIELYEIATQAAREKEEVYRRARLKVEDLIIREERRTKTTAAPPRGSVGSNDPKKYLQ